KPAGLGRHTPIANIRSARNSEIAIVGSLGALARCGVVPYMVRASPRTSASDVIRRQPAGALHSMWLLTASMTGSMLGPGEAVGSTLARATSGTSSTAAPGLPESQGLSSA